LYAAQPEAVHPVVRQVVGNAYIPEPEITAVAHPEGGSGLVIAVVRIGGQAWIGSCGGCFRGPAAGDLLVGLAVGEVQELEAQVSSKAGHIVSPVGHALQQGAYFQPFPGKAGGNAVLYTRLEGTDGRFIKLVDLAITIQVPVLYIAGLRLVACNGSAAGSFFGRLEKAVCKVPEAHAYGQPCSFVPLIITALLVHEQHFALLHAAVGGNEIMEVAQPALVGERKFPALVQVNANVLRGI